MRCGYAADQRMAQVVSGGIVAGGRTYQPFRVPIDQQSLVAVQQTFTATLVGPIRLGPRVAWHLGIGCTMSATA